MKTRVPLKSNEEDFTSSKTDDKAPLINQDKDTKLEKTGEEFENEQSLDKLTSQLMAEHMKNGNYTKKTNVCKKRGTDIGKKCFL